MKKINEYTDEEIQNMSSEEFIEFVAQADREIADTWKFIEENNKKIEEIERRKK